MCCELKLNLICFRIKKIRIKINDIYYYEFYKIIIKI